ncbi:MULTISPECIES: HlyC/CorC family transporter [Anaerostipes]|uniref:HlyC/CorC family transporter n=1 Tax=Anaerostipes TaxID=207244 RepID=UPI000953369D|nr:MULTISPECIES: hemolysin family protein [Anaerostipes]MCI5623344.1 hemolysin family protein [Anaerostipes sp.]MDY2727165.1 hemolysin family protein [Anaerostipes faecalis]OLR58768.1 hemolysin [Anaerostipes sp. 494a]
MDPSVIFQLIGIIILLALSAYFSSAETALTTVNQHAVRAIAEDGDKRAETVLKLIENPSQMLSSILVGNNLVNISVTSLSTTLAIEIFGNMGAGIATGILTVLVLIFGEITPKTYATIKNTKLALSYASSIYFITRLLTPVVFIINKLSTGLLILLHIDSKQSKQIMTERELRTIVDVSHEDGVIEDDEKDMLNNVFDFKDAIAKDIMIPRIDVSFVSIDSSYDEVMETFTEARFSRLPVYEGSKDKVVGIVYLKDVYFYRTKHRDEVFQLKDVLREPFFTYETQKVSSLLSQMREKSVSFSIVLDEYGITAGLITLEDIVEEIFGEIRDEYDQDEMNSFQQLDDGSYLVDASMKLDDLNDLIDTDITSEDYDSLGGYMIELLDHLPEEGETAEDQQFIFQIDHVEKNRMETIHMKRKSHTETE